MRRILWNFGLFAAWIVAVMFYGAMQYGVLGYLRPSPTGEHGWLAGVFLVLVGGLMAIPLGHFWIGREPGGPP